MRATTELEESRMKDIHEIAPGMTNAGQPLEDVATAGQPKKEHFQRLAEAGYKTVIDLRTLEESRGVTQVLICLLIANSFPHLHMPSHSIGRAGAPISYGGLRLG